MLGEATHGTHEYYRLAGADQPAADRGEGLLLRRRRGRLARLRPGQPLASTAAPDAPTTRGGAASLRPLADLDVGQRGGRRLLPSGCGRYNAGATGADRVGFHGLDVYSLWESLQRGLRLPARARPDQVAGGARSAFRCFEPYGEDPQEYALATRFVPERLRAGGGRPARADAPAEARPPTATEALLGLAERGGGGRAPSAYYRAMVRGGPRVVEHPRHATWPTRWTGCCDHYGPDAQGDRLGAQHPRRRRPRHRHGRRRHGQHRPAGPRTPRRRRRGAGRLRQPPGHGDRRARWGAPMRDDARAAGRARVAGGRAARGRRRTGRCSSSRPSDQPDWLTDVTATGRSGWSTTRSASRRGNYVPTVLATATTPSSGATDTTALHPLPVTPATQEPETFPTGV